MHPQMQIWGNKTSENQIDPSVLSVEFGHYIFVLFFCPLPGPGPPPGPGPHQDQVLGPGPHQVPVHHQATLGPLPGPGHHWARVHHQARVSTGPGSTAGPLSTCVSDGMLYIIKYSHHI